VNRGCGWGSDPGNLRCADLDKDDAGDARSDYGLMVQIFAGLIIYQSKIYSNDNFVKLS
jgi:hypothetical protein